MPGQCGKKGWLEDIQQGSRKGTVFLHSDSERELCFRPQRVFLHIEPGGLSRELYSVFLLDSFNLLEMQFFQQPVWLWQISPGRMVKITWSACLSSKLPVTRDSVEYFLCIICKEKPVSLEELSIGISLWSPCLSPQRLKCLCFLLATHHSTEQQK